MMVYLESYFYIEPCHIPKHTHFCNAAAWTASRLQTKPCKLSLSRKHQATSRRAKQGHKPGTQTNLELAC